MEMTQDQKVNIGLIYIRIFHWQKGLFDKVIILAKVNPQKTSLLVTNSDDEPLGLGTNSIQLIHTMVNRTAK